MKTSTPNNIRAARKNAKLTMKQLGALVDASESSISQYETGKRQPDNEMLLKLAEALGTTVGYLLCAEQNPASKTEKAPSLSDEAARIAKRYAALDVTSRGAISALIQFYETQNPAPAPETKVIPFILQSFAAGNGEPDFGNLVLDTYEVPAESKAEFACRVHGDSLEPYYHDGDIALGVNRYPGVGEVGVFLVDGEYKIKQYVADSFRNLYLFAVNRSRSDTDQTLWAKDEHAVTCLGTILMPKRIPLPD